MTGGERLSITRGMAYDIAWVSRHCEGSARSNPVLYKSRIPRGGVCSRAGPQRQNLEYLPLISEPNDERFDAMEADQGDGAG